MHAPKSKRLGFPLDAPSKLSLMNPTIGGLNLTIDLSIRICKHVDMRDPN